MKKAAIYARVSTRDQTPELQLRELREYAKRRDFNVVEEFVDKAQSGAKESRPALNQLMQTVRKREVDVVLVWKFDRFARSARQLVNSLEEFQTLGVDFVSYTEQVDTTSPAGKALFTMVSAFAEFERSLIGERVRAGLDRAREEGIPLGRPQLPQATIAKIKRLRRKKHSVRQTARKVGVSVGVVSKYA